MISLTPHFRRKPKVWLPFFAKNAQNNPKKHSYEDNAKFHSAFLPTMLSYASRFRQNRGVIENRYLDEFEEDLRKCWLYCVLYLIVIERCKNKFKNRLWKSRACVTCTFKAWQRGEERVGLHFGPKPTVPTPVQLINDIFTPLDAHSMYVLLFLFYLSFIFPLFNHFPHFSLSFSIFFALDRSGLMQNWYFCNGKMLPRFHGVPNVQSWYR